MVYAPLVPDYAKNKTAALNERSAVYFAGKINKTTPFLFSMERLVIEDEFTTLCAALPGRPEAMVLQSHHHWADGRAGQATPGQV